MKMKSLTILTLVALVAALMATTAAAGDVSHDRAAVIVATQTSSLGMSPFQAIARLLLVVEGKSSRRTSHRSGTWQIPQSPGKV